MDLNHLSHSEKLQFEKLLIEKGQQFEIEYFSNLNKQCFKDCCTDFTTKMLSKKEEKCIVHCFMKFNGSFKRIQSKFWEANAELSLRQQFKQRTAYILNLSEQIMAVPHMLKTLPIC